MNTKYYVKAMGSTCYDMHGITFPELKDTRHFTIVDERIPDCPTEFEIKIDNGLFNVEHVFHYLGARGMKWGRRWSNQPDVLMFDKLVDYYGNEVDDVCDDAKRFLFKMGLIIRPISDWLPTD